jgi:hypothetical protein
MEQNQNEMEANPDELPGRKRDLYLRIKGEISPGSEMLIGFKNGIIK